MEMTKEDIENIFRELRKENPYPDDVFIRPTKEDWSKLSKLFKSAGMEQTPFFIDAMSRSYDNALYMIEKRILEKILNNYTIPTSNRHYFNVTSGTADKRPGINNSDIVLTGDYRTGTVLSNQCTLRTPNLDAPLLAVQEVLEDDGMIAKVVCKLLTGNHNEFIPIEYLNSSLEIEILD